MRHITKLALAFATLAALGCQPETKAPPAKKSAVAEQAPALPGWYGTISPIPGPNERIWYPPPAPIEKTLFDHYGDDIPRLTAQIEKPHQPNRNVYDCLIELRRDTPVLQTLQLAEVYNTLVQENIPSYQGRQTLPIPPSAAIAKLTERMEQRRRECLDFIPTAAPELEVDHNDRDEASRWARQESFKALEQMGNGLLDRAHKVIWSKGQEQPPSEPACRVLREGLSRWERTLMRIPDSVAEDNYEIQADRLREGVNHLCR